MSGHSAGLARLVVALAAVVVIAGPPGAGRAQDSLRSLSNESLTTYDAQPLTAGGNAPAIVMMGLSVDEQLYGHAYDDSSDLDGDGLLDTGYRDRIDYLGYFDPGLCYRHADGRYKAAGPAAGPHRHHCLAAQAGLWSGNFLNWLSMSRLDLIRWSLYGGRRSTDSLIQTVLERSHVPPDGHAWAKFHDGSDAQLYTPFAQDPAHPGLSFCNLSYTAGGDADSAASTAPPLLRVARGLHRFWASSEARQCLWQEESGAADQPARSSAALGDGDYLLRVEVCDPTAAAEQRESWCRQYPNALKPAGLLQVHGEAGQLQFGLLSGSYAKPRSGGQLRRNAGPLVGNGAGSCAAGDEINLATGQFCISGAGAEGLINTLDRYRIARYRSADSGPQHLDCARGSRNRGALAPVLANPGSGSNACNSWGNPLAEIHAEILRYLSGAAAASPAFAGDDASYLPGLPTATWRDAYAHTEHCAKCSIVMLATGTASYDSDEIPPLPALGGAIAAAATDRIGSNESLTGPSLIGRISLTPANSDTPVTDGDRCDTQNLDRLSLARGICPAAPSREGSYLIAGLAHRAWTGDLRPDVPTDRASEGQQRARTWGLEFISSRPAIPIHTVTGTLHLTPHCETNAAAAPALEDPGWRSCGFLNMTPGPVDSAVPRGSGLTPYRYGRALDAAGRSGSVLVTWDESGLGGDQDRDLLQLLSWCVGADCSLDQNAPVGPDICWRAAASALCNAEGQLARAIGEDEVLVRTELLAASEADSNLLGYVISGAASGNGTQRLSFRQRGDDASLLSSSAEPLLSSDALDGPAGRWSRPRVASYRPGAGAGRVLPSPLHYAAKYGGFEYPADAADPLPAPDAAGGNCSDSSWDQANNDSGARGADCIPDQYFALGNPGQLKSRLATVFEHALRRSGSNRQTPVLSASTLGPGAVYQSSYQAVRRDDAGRTVHWIGTLQALFVDRDGRYREDGNGNARLDEDDYSASGDPVVELYHDADQHLSRFRRYHANPALAPGAYTVIDEPGQLATLWNAARQLSAVSEVATQRSYAASAASGRYILSFVDRNLDGKAQAGEQVDFVPASFGAGRQGLLNVASPEAAARLIRHARGVDTPDLRNRRVDVDGDGSPEVLRLGDLVNSVPVVVGAPAEAYDLIYGDRTYAAFFERYRSRRQVVYVGANDGMLHAFNAGFHDAATRSFRTTPQGAGSASAHPLGSELWAYVPFNLLPQLGWLADPRYGHLWTLDGSPRVFDARVFAADADHPQGWGSLLVIGMRLGGGPVTIPEVGIGGANRAALGDLAAGLGSRSSLVLRSAYAILDISNPELPPRLIAEFSDEHGLLGYTTSAPAIAAFGSRGSTAGSTRDDRWLLWFGNGPNQLQTATSTGSGRLYGLDLTSLVAAANSSQPASAALVNAAPFELGSDPASGLPAGFVGDPVSVDWDLDFLADALYVGGSSGTAASPGGKLFKLDFRESATPSDWTAPAVLLDTGRPVLAAPSATQDRSARRWLLSGTGRLLAADDKRSRADQALFGVIDKLPASPATSYASLVDTSAAVVSRSGAVSGVSGASSEATLVSVVVAGGGWRLALAVVPTAAAERSVQRTALIDGLLFATAYTPAASLCAGDGSSRLFGIDFQTGAPRATRPAFGSRRVTVLGAEVDAAVGVVELGAGFGSPPGLHVDEAEASGPGLVTVHVQTSSGTVAQQDIPVSAAIRSGEIDWRQTRRGR